MAAYAFIAADGYAMPFSGSDAVRAEYLEKSLDAANRAVELDADNGKVQWNAAYSQFVAGNVEAFRSHAAKALAINPNDPDVKGYAGTLIIFIGDYEEGLALLQESIRLNPHHPEWWQNAVAIAYWMTGKPQDALDVMLKVNQPGNPWTHILRAILFTKLDRSDEVAASLRELERVYPGFNVTSYRKERSIWNFAAEIIEKGADELRKAGLPEGAD